MVSYIVYIELDPCIRVWCCRLTHVGNDWWLAQGSWVASLLYNFASLGSSIICICGAGGVEGIICEVMWWEDVMWCDAAACMMWCDVMWDRQAAGSGWLLASCLSAVLPYIIPEREREREREEAEKEEAACVCVWEREPSWVCVVCVGWLAGWATVWLAGCVVVWNEQVRRWWECMHYFLRRFMPSPFFPLVPLADLLGVLAILNCRRWRKQVNGKLVRISNKRRNRSKQKFKCYTSNKVSHDW